MNVTAEHDVDISGRSGVEHQVDVHWQFKLATVQHKVLVECKNYSSAITLEKIRNFHAVLMDIGNCAGIMVTKTGYQRGVKQYADYYGIDLKLLRKPKEEDWEGRIKDIHFKIHAKALESTEEHPVKVNLQLEASSPEQKSRMSELIRQGKVNVGTTPDMRFLDSKGVPITKELRYWLPESVSVLDKEPGGPYTQEIQMENHYVLVSIDDDEELLIQVPAVTVKYYVFEMDTEEFVIQGDEIVRSILKDAQTGNIDYTDRR